MFVQIAFTLMLASWVAAQTPNCSGPPPIRGMNVKKCCPISPMFDPTVFATCKTAQSTSSPSSGEHARGHGHWGGPCMAACVYEKAGVWKNNAIDREALVALVTKTVNNVEWSKMLTAEIDACIASANAKQTEWAAKPSKCNRAPGHIMHCIQKALIQTCPAPTWSNTDECNAFRAYMKACPRPNHHSG